MIGRGRIGGSGHNSNIVGMASGVGIGNWKSSSNLANGVSISLSFSLSFSLSLTLAISIVGKTRITIGNRGSSIAKMSNTSIAKVSSISTVSNTSISMIGRGRIGGSGHNSNIVGMASGVGIGNWKSSSNLANGVSISFSISLCLSLSFSL